MGFFKRLIKYIIIKIRWNSKVKFGFSTDIVLSSKFEGMNKVHPYTTFKGELGYGSYIGKYSYLNGKIGRFTSIAPFVRCNAGKHPISYPYAATSPSFYTLENTKGQNGHTFATEECFNQFAYYDHNKKYTIEIGNDCWIGEGAFLVGGIKISDGAIVYAHAVVTKDIPPYAIVGGVPAKILGYRYSEKDVEFLLKIKWWTNTYDWFKENWKLLTDISALKEYYGV